MSIPEIGGQPTAPSEHGQEGLKDKRTERQKAHAEVFGRIKERTREDRAPVKIKLKNVRLFDDQVIKEAVTPAEKENRSLNVTSRLKMLSAALLSEGFTEDQVHLILGEYKTKLKEGGEIGDAISFSEYIIKKQSDTDKLSPEQRTIIEKFVALRKKPILTHLDQAFISRKTGAEKAVYCFDTMAVLTPRQIKSANALEQEYAMTIDLRVNQMQRVLTNHLLTQTHSVGPELKTINTIILDYKKALETDMDIEDASSFFRMHQEDYPLEGLDIMALGQEIDDNLDGLDISRKKLIEDDVVYYVSKKAECDLKAFLSNSKRQDKLNIDDLSPRQLEIFLNAFDKIKIAMNKSNLLHGDIKPDNILIYREIGPNGEPYYIPRISDYGKSKLGTTHEIWQIHTGNPRFHKGAYDTFETQADSLNAIKLLVLNSRMKHKTDREGIKKIEKLKTTALKANKKIVDVVESPFGFYVYLQGLNKSNYFSNLGDTKTSRFYNAMSFGGTSTRSTLLTNTVIAALQFLHQSKEIPTDQELATLTLEDLKRMEIETIKRLETFKLLEAMDTSHSKHEAIQNELQEFTALLETLRRELTARGSPN